jgi:pimeloyl-ACP methyl ester carboxylesterase
MRAIRLIPTVLLASVLVAGCGGQQAAKAPPKPKIVVNGGSLVDIGGGRSLYLNCVGSGSPTVLLEAGFGGTTNNWSAVQPQLARTTRVCSYDRAGLGNSLPIPGVHDAADEIADLQRLLGHARIAPPYVLVGHSYGGLLARLFAHAHPGDTAGVVLVDAMGRDQDRTFAAAWRRAPARIKLLAPKPDFPAIENGVNLRASEALDARVRTLGDTPLAVITRGQAEDQGASLPAPVRRATERLWTTMQDELAAMSTDHVHVVALRSGHFVQGYADGQPAVVVRAVRAVTEAARTGGRLPECPRVFTGPGVRCRE